MQIPLSSKRIFHLPILGWAVLIFGILLTISSSIKDFRVLELQNKLAFDSEVLRIKSRIINKLESNENNLIQVRGFFISHNMVTREMFRKYVQDTQFIEKYPGVQGLAYTIKINSKDLKSHVEEIRKSGIKGYKVWPDTPRETYYSIIYIEPFGWRNQRAIGYDMFTEPIRHEAMMNALDSGKPKITKKILLMQETEKDTQPGLILYLPIYKPGADISSKEARENAITGFVYSVFRAKDLFRSIFADSELKMNFEIYDEAKMNSDTLLYSNDDAPHFYKKKFKPSFFKAQSFEFSGQTFTLYINSGPLFQKHRNHSYLWILFGGLFVTLLITWIIVSTKKQADDLIKVQKALQEVVVTRDEFLSIASHELRTPMTSLKLHTQMLKKKINNAEDLNTHKEKIETVLNQNLEQVAALNRLIDDMLDVTRLRTGNLKLEISEIDLADLIHQSVNNLTEQMNLSGYPPPKIEISGNLKGKCDQMRIGQVVANFLTNAIRYGKQKTITIKAEELIDTIRVSVADQGIGISEEDKERIFGRFERATSSSEARGLGMGLYISEQIIIAHKGKIWVESKLNEGSIFIFGDCKKFCV